MGKESSGLAAAGDGGSAKQDYSLSDLLAIPDARKIIDSIEEAAGEIRGRGIDWNDESEFWVRAYNDDVKRLKQKYGYTWR